MTAGLTSTAAIDAVAAVTAADRWVEVVSVLAATLAGVFAVAAIAKLTDPSTTIAEFRALGVPGARPLARLVPLAELGTAGLLLAAPRPGAVVSLALLSAFTAVLAAVVRSGREVSCGCLGGRNRSPITALTLARNGALMILAGAVATVEALVIPSPPTVLAVGSILVAATVAGQLLTLRAVVGRLWDLGPAGEPTPAGPPAISPVAPADPDLKGMTA
ncbi:MAG: MauE/DoxX family redox-associated membrane protein [Actinomycetota bacterium]